jgi:tellurite resistance protein
MAGWSSIQETLRAEIGGQQFLEASIAACALIALADGGAAASERTALDSALRDLCELEESDAARAGGLYDQYLKALRDESGAARRDLLEKVAQFSGDERAGSAILALCVEIGKGDRVFQQPEYEELRQLAGVLRVDLAVLEE